MGRTLFRGHRGEDVRELQNLLSAAGHDPGPVDGVFGAATESAVRKFQQAQGLVVDGAAGPVTMARLRAVRPPGRPQGRSLHIGLNRVDPAAYPVVVPELRGCENDARDMYSIARGQGFDARPPLLNGDATSARVAAEIADAATALRPGDFFWLTYSGHGAQLPDLDGDEPDKLDETWVLYDRQLLDDELKALWRRFREGVEIFVCSDSCHSGTVARSANLTYRAVRLVDGVDGFVDREISRDIGTDPELNSALSEIMPAVAKSLYGAENAPERAGRLVSLAVETVRTALGSRDGDPTTRSLSDITALADLAARRDLYAAAKRRAADTGDIAATVLLLSGCQDNQVSLDGRRNGLFTQKFLEVWRQASSYEDLHRRVVATMPPQQTPNLYRATPQNLVLENRLPLTVKH
jgi:hypothetical protein